MCSQSLALSEAEGECGSLQGRGHMVDDWGVWGAGQGHHSVWGLSRMWGYSRTWGLSRTWGISRMWGISRTWSRGLQVMAGFAHRGQGGTEGSR